MSGNELDFLEEEPKPEGNTEGAEKPEGEHPEGEQPEGGEGSQEGEKQEEAAPPAAEEKQAQNVPLTALLDEREKRQKYERELEEMRRWRQQVEGQQRQPSFRDNPEAVLSQMQQQQEQRLVAEKLKQSRFMAEREFGKDTVDEAYKYFDEHPQESQALLNEPSPFHAAVEHYKRQKLLQEVGSDPEAWREKERERLKKELMSESAQKKPDAPPRSLASAPGSGGRDSQSPGSAFDEEFG